MTRPSTSGWERFPSLKTLDGQVWLCRWCRKPLSGRKTAYCSSECQDEVERRCVFSRARFVCWNNSGGKCAACGLEIDALEEAIQFVERLHKQHVFTLFSPMWEGMKPSIHAFTVREFCNAIGDAASAWPRVLWECNHIIPLVEGGGLCDQDNLEILCIPCHKKHTAALMKRLSLKKPPANSVEIVGDLFGMLYSENDQAVGEGARDEG